VEVAAVVDRQTVQQEQQILEVVVVARTILEIPETVLPEL
jgi:hypothetical protein